MTLRVTPSFFDPSKAPLFGLFHVGGGLRPKRLLVAYSEIDSDTARGKIVPLFDDDLPENRPRLVVICAESEVSSAIDQWSVAVCPCEECARQRLQIDERRN